MRDARGWTMGVDVGTSSTKVVLVDDDGVPVHVLQVLPVRVALERVDRDDDPLVVRERVATRGDLLLNALDAEAVQPDQRNGEPGPQLLLELLQDLLRRDHQDPVTTSPSDQLR